MFYPFALFASISQQPSGMGCLLLLPLSSRVSPEDYAKAQGLAKAFKKANIAPLVGDWRTEGRAMSK